MADEMAEENGGLVPLPAAESLPALIDNAEHLRPVLDSIEARARSETFDIETRKGREAAKSLGYKATRTKTLLVKAGEAATADAKAQIQRVRENTKEVQHRMDALRDEIRGPALEWEARDKERTDRIEGWIARLDELSAPAFDATIERLDADAAEIERIAGESLDEYAEHAAPVIERARRVNATAAKSAREREEQRREREAERQELEQLRREKAERERQDRAAEAKRLADEEAKRQREEATRANEARAQAKAKAETERWERQKREVQVEAESEMQTALADALEAPAAPAPPAEAMSLGAAIDNLLFIVAQSEGITGWHRNGDILSWGDLSDEIDALARHRNERAAA